MSVNRPYYTVECVTCGDRITVGTSNAVLLSQCEKCKVELDRKLREAREQLAASERRWT